MNVEVVLEISGTAAAAADLVENRLVAADADEVKIDATQERSGFGEPVTILAVVIVAAQTGVQLIRQLRVILRELDGLRQDWAKLRHVRVVTRAGERDLGEVTAEELAAETEPSPDE